MTAPSYDLTIKSLIDHRYSTFVGLLCEQEVKETYSLEVGSRVKRFADAVALLENADLVHIEFQTKNEGEMPWRMLEYNVEIVRRFDQRSEQSGHSRAFPPKLRQMVIFVGDGKVTMRSSAKYNGVEIKFEVLDIRGMFENGDRLMESKFYRDWILAVLCMKVAKDDFGRAAILNRVREVVRRIGKFTKGQQQEAYYLLQVVANRRNLTDHLISEINAMSFDIDSARESPLIVQAMDHARAEGYALSLYEILQNGDDKFDDFLWQYLAALSNDKCRALAVRIKEDGLETVRDDIQLRQPSPMIDL